MGSPFVARLDASGAHVWSMQWHSDTAGRPHIHTPSDGAVYVSGSLAGSATFAGKALVAPGVDVLLASLSSDGTLIDAQVFGDNDAQWVDSLALDPSGFRIVSGLAYGHLDFGFASVSGSNGDSTFYVAKLPD